MQEPPNPSRLITARRLRKGFVSGGREFFVLDGLDFNVNEGETLSIRGESGSGKTTLLNVLAGLECSDGGELAWRGEPVKGTPGSLAPRRAGFIGFVFQAYHLVPELNALENVELAARLLGGYGRQRRDWRERAKALLERVGLAERLRAKVTTLSGGERQRVAIARALLTEPPVLFADEPTGNLDEGTSRRVMELLLAIVAERGMSLVLVTHDTGFANRTAHQWRLVSGQLQPAA